MQTGDPLLFLWTANSVPLSSNGQFPSAPCSWETGFRLVVTAFLATVGAVVARGDSFVWHLLWTRLRPEAILEASVDPLIRSTNYTRFP